MSLYLPHVKLANVATGQAEVRWFTPFSPDVPFGESRSLGWVIHSLSGKWVVQLPDHVRVGAFRTRKAAVDHLVANRAVDQVS
jgi:hypothetical protein